ncbi:MAG: hypothetical protein WD716_12735 [Fimbriimonadaceae bacterium]
MHDHHEDDPEVLSEIEKLGYDPRDVPIGETPKHAIALFVSVGAVMLISVGIMTVIDRYQGSTLVGSKDVSDVRRERAPEEPYPVVQTNLSAKTDIHDLRRDEMIKTTTYGWVDKAAGVASIPVDEAKAILLSEGMPTTAGQGLPASITGEDPSAPGTPVTVPPSPRGAGQ